jgi:hypothetical protein
MKANSSTCEQVCINDCNRGWSIACIRDCLSPVPISMRTHTREDAPWYAKNEGTSLSRQQPNPRAGHQPGASRRFVDKRPWQWHLRTLRLDYAHFPRQTNNPFPTFYNGTGGMHVCTRRRHGSAARYQCLGPCSVDSSRQHGSDSVDLPPSNPKQRVLSIIRRSLFLGLDL